MEFKEKSLETIHVAEPELNFRFGQKTDYPKDGLYLYGPVETALRKVVSVGVVGTTDGLKYFRAWANELVKGIVVAPPTIKEKKEDRLHLSDFPGLEESFDFTIDPTALVEYTVKLADIETTTATENLHEAVAKTVDLYVSKVEHHSENEERAIDVWVFVLPEIIFLRCKSKARRTGVTLSPGEYVKKQKARSDMPLLASVIDTSEEDIFDDTPDFHRQVKARLLHLNCPSQLVRETTLAPGEFLNKAGWPVRRTQDRAIVAWNFATGLYYKSQPEPPWGIADMRPGVCYVGLVFKLIPNDPEENACCAAQMFLSEGDGVVFRGANGPWQTSKKEFHLKKEAAKALMERVLDTYKSKFKEYPKELFIHGRTSFNNEEWAGFESAAPIGTNIVGVRIKSTHGEMKLYREGDYPCLRGTAILLDEQNAFLWASGYLSRLGTYIGPETPNPLYVSILRSTGDVPNIRDVLRDIMGLTKINYNACNFSDGIPVTIRFADRVGDILVMGSARGADRQPFKFYI